LPESTSAPSSSSNTSSQGTTQLIHGIDNVINTELQFFSNARKRIDTCMNYTRPELATVLKPIRKAFLNAKNRSVELRYITEITKDNVSYCKDLMTMVDELRHLEGIKGNFMLSETEYLSPIILFEKGKVASQIVYSNLAQIVEQQQYFFDTLWNKAVPAKDRINELEHGVESPFIETIRDPVKIQTIAFNHVQSAIEEILIIFSTANAFYRQIVVAGGLQLCKEAASERNVKIRILTPKDDRVEQIVHELLQEQPQEQQTGRIDIRYIEPALETKTTVLIVDNKFSLSVEVKDDTKNTSFEAMGLATYSNSTPTVLSYASIFESLWNQTDLYEQLKAHDKMQKEFIDIAAHELRTPIQPILGLAQVLQSRLKSSIEHQELIDTIVRNAKRLQQLTENILDVTRIESNSLQLNKEEFNLGEMVLIAIADCRSQLKEYDDSLRLELVSKEDIFVEADKARIGQVISNLLNNAIKFTREEKDKEESIVSVTLEEHKHENNKEVMISVKDKGIGIAPEIMPRLFTKFATKSERGTGLGLFISKSIIESHGGKIWGENNIDGKGATFSFSLPTINK
jgi:two-component system, OmpR family, sensor histidine kinase VicK